MEKTNPLTIPPLPPDVAEYAEITGKTLILVSLSNKPTREQLMAEGMNAVEGHSFWTVADAVPRIGESIRTQNMKQCEVKLVVHLLVPTTHKSTTIFSLTPCVMAMFKEQDKG